MKQVRVAREIAARPDEIWPVLTDARRLVALDTGITRIDGRIASGETFTLTADVSGSRSFRITVAEITAPSRMVWKSGNAVFRGERLFTLTPTASGTRFEMVETFTGLMLPLIWRSMPDLTPSFEQFAAAIAAETERKAA